MADEIIPGMSLPTIDPTSLARGVNMAMMVGLAIAVIGIIVFIGMKKKWFFKFPTTFDIMKVENGVLTTVDTDQGRRVLKKNKDGSIKELYYDIKKRNFKWYPPSFESSIGTKRGKSKFYVRELYPNKWEIIDPKSFVTGSPADYKRVEGDELDSYFKNTQDDMAELKYKFDEGTLNKLLNMIAPILPIIVAGVVLIIIMTQAVIPMWEKAAGAVSENYQLSNDNLNQSIQLLDKSTQYIDYLTRLLIANGMKVPVTIVNATNVSVT